MDLTIGSLRPGRRVTTIPFPLPEGSVLDATHYDLDQRDHFRVVLLKDGTTVLATPEAAARIERAA